MKQSRALLLLTQLSSSQIGFLYLDHMTKKVNSLSSLDMAVQDLVYVVLLFLIDHDRWG
jgi:hypothetical protein